MQATNSVSTSAQWAPIKSLTSLRFVAAMTVVVYHYFSLILFSSSDAATTAQLNPISQWLGTYVYALTNGYLAVGFFFVLSGFVLAYGNFHLIEEGLFEYVPFLKRRFARIYPLHFLVTIGYGALFLLALCLGITVNNSDNFTWTAFLSNVFLLRGLNLIGRLTYNGPAWYVSSQWHLYLLFPVLAFCVLRSPFKSITTLFLTVVFFLGMYYEVSDDRLLTMRTHDFGILRAISEFPIGLALYRVFRDYQKSQAASIRPMHVVIAGLAVFLASQFNLSDALIALLLTALIFICAATELHHEMKWLTHPWLVYGGELSYAIYLLHVPFLACARKTFPLFGAANGSMAEGFATVACVILLLPTAALVHRWVELPANEWTGSLLTRPGSRSLSTA